jgi:heat shock protein HtpX
MAVFFVLVAVVGYGASLYFGSPAYLYVSLAFAVIMNVYSYWFSDRQVLRMTNARPARRDEFFDFYTVAENMAITAGIPMPKLYVIEDHAPNAFATGRNQKHAVVCATTGILSMLTRAELEGVIAHEMSHIRNKDMLVMTVAVVLAGFLATIADMFFRVSMWGGGGSDRENKGGLLIVLAIVGAVLAPIAAQLIQLAISRRREYLADASGALLCRHPEALASALAKIGSYASPMHSASTATAHLFISNPFGAGKATWIANLFATHPPIQDRINALLGTSHSSF